MPALINKSNRKGISGKPLSVTSRMKNNLRDVLAEKMSVHFPDIVDAHVSMAKGYEHTQVLPDGTIQQFKELPNERSARLLMEYTMEKPKQTVEHKGGMGIVHLVAQLENGDQDS